MPNIKIKPENSSQLEKIEEIIFKTEIVKREFELEFGKWNFVVIGPSKKGQYVVREGFANHMMIHTSPLYSASIGRPDIVGADGIPIEEFIEDGIPEELEGVDVYSVDPVRPLTINKKTEVKGDASVQKVIDDYSKGRIAVIITPDEKFWFISVLKYLNECDDFFPDQFIQGIRNGDLPVKAKLLNSSAIGKPGSKLLN